MPARHRGPARAKGDEMSGDYVTAAGEGLVPL